MASIFDYELGDEAVPGYKIVAEITATNYYRLLKVQGPDHTYKLWKKIDLTAAASIVETRLLGLLNKLDHPGLNRITNLYRINGGKGLIIQTEFPAMTIKERLNEVTRPLMARGIPVRGLGIPPEELLRYTEQMAEAIDFLNAPQHEYKGEKMAIMHRALRPECMLLFDTLQGRLCKVSDFGLAKATMGIEAAQHSLGWSQQEFSPPEFADGHTAASSDQFSLAAVYYYLRSNEFPYMGTLLQQMQAQMNDDPCLELVPQMERDAIRRALAGDPSRRYPSCLAFVQELSQAIPRAPGAPAGVTGSSANIYLGNSAAAAAAPRTAAVFYRRGTGLSQMEIDLPPGAPAGASSGSINIAGPQARASQAPISTPQGLSLGQAPVTPPSSPAVPATPPTRSPQPLAPVGARPASGGSVPAIAAKSGEKPKVYMPRSRADLVLPPIPDMPAGSKSGVTSVPKPLTQPQPAPPSGLSGQSYPGIPTAHAPAAAAPPSPAAVARPPQAVFAQQQRGDAPQAARPQSGAPPWSYQHSAQQAAPPTRNNHTTSAPPWTAQQQPVPPLPPWANQQAGYPQLPAPWANSATQHPPQWTMPTAGQPAPAGPPTGRRRRLWTWIQLVVLVVAAAILAYTYLGHR